MTAYTIKVTEHKPASLKKVYRKKTSVNKTQMFRKLFSFCSNLNEIIYNHIISTQFNHLKRFTPTKIIHVNYKLNEILYMEMGTK